MSMPAIEVSEELAQQIDTGAHRAGETRDVFLREAVLTRLEDMEDLAIAQQRLNNPGERISFDQVKRDLGLDD
jgi:RHH-type rel operon transcriptional repressor/antitoxin RelB